MTAMKRGLVVAIVAALALAPTAAFAEDSTDTPLRDRPTDLVTDAETDLRGDSLEELKERALETIEKSLAALGGLRAAIGRSPYITDGHAAQLLRDINAAADGLQELARKIEAATTPEELRPLIEAIPGFQIGHVLAPKTHQVIVSDSMVAIGGKLKRFADKLEGLIARAEEAGYDVDEAWRMLESMNDHIAEGVRLADPVAEAVIGLQPEDWPEPAKSVLGKGRSDLHAAGGNLRSAYATGKEIVQFLRGLFDGTDLSAEVSDVIPG
jgi:hypothetical protein